MKNGIEEESIRLFDDLIKGGLHILNQMLPLIPYVVVGGVVVGLVYSCHNGNSFACDMGCSIFKTISKRPHIVQHPMIQ